MNKVMTEIMKLSESNENDDYICEHCYSHKPNKKTMEAMDNIINGKNLTTYKTEDELFKSWGL